MRLNLAQREAIQGYLYLTPWALGFLIFTFVPMVASLYLSLTSYNIVSPPKFVGLDNYARLTEDPLVRKSLGNTFYYALIFVPLHIVGSLCCATLLNQKIKGRALFRSLYFLPSITPVVASAFLWLWIFQPYVGLLNHFLSLVGISPGPGWFASVTWSKPALIIISLWGAVGGGTMLIFLAGLQGIPQELLEAAEIDGAGRWSKFRHVTLPLLTPSIFFALILGLIGALQMFTLAFVATGGTGIMHPAGGPVYSTLFYVLHLYTNAFDYWQMGYASALAWVFFLIVLVLTFIQLRLSRSWVYYEAEAGVARW